MSQTITSQTTTLVTHAVPDDLQALVTGVSTDLAPVFEAFEWAEDEIERACARHPRHTDVLFHSFSLLAVTADRMATEWVYRSHCRELLDRVAAGADTRPGTAAEVALLMLAVTQATPVTGAAFGLYVRMWRAAGFPDNDVLTERGQHYEALKSDVIDDHEASARGKLAVPARRLGDIQCSGRHHDEPVSCVYARAEQLDLLG